MFMANSITKDELKQNNEYVIIDVRETDELEKGKIDGSKHMSLGLIIRNVKQGQIDELKELGINTNKLAAVEYSITGSLDKPNIKVTETFKPLLN